MTGAGEQSPRPGPALAYVAAHRSRILAELNALLRFPTISAQPDHVKALQRCAAWLASHLRRIGLEHVNVHRTAGHPVVMGHWLHAPERPTLLVYGHYDVQPVEPINEWRSPPFEPVIREGNLYARGASDDKGQLFTHLKAIEAYLETANALPVNVVCVIEGEEEIGSPHLESALDRNPDMTRTDVAVVSDSPILGPDQPALTYALRGALSLELMVEGPASDLHSGTFGGTIHNPLQVLCEIVAGFHHRDGRVAVPGFYDRVTTPSTRELSYLASVGPTEERMLATAGVALSWGEMGYTPYERTTIRPALTVNGLSGGYGGPGAKAIIPAYATTKLNLRLVPDQDPAEVDALVRRHIARQSPLTVRVGVRTTMAARPVVVDRHHPAFLAAANAYRQAFGVAPDLLRSGGTIPVVALLQQRLGIPTVLMGFGLPDDAKHAPNEKMHIKTYFRGVATSVRFMAGVGGGVDLTGTAASR